MVNNTVVNNTVVNNTVVKTGQHAVCRGISSGEWRRQFQRDQCYLVNRVFAHNC